jgi:hypothetical protein
LIVLDLKDDARDTDFNGSNWQESVYSMKIKRISIRPRHFLIPGLPHKVEDIWQNPFVKVLARGGADQIRTAIQEIFSTQIPQLLRHLEEEKRSYMWDTLLNHNQCVAGRRPGRSGLPARQKARQCAGEQLRPAFPCRKRRLPGEIDSAGIHPVEMYVYPPVEPDLLAGDIIKCGEEANAEYWVILTPSCDLVSGRAKAEQVLLAKCLPLENFSTVVDFKREPDRNLKELESLIRNRSGRGRQEFRYHFPSRNLLLAGLFWLIFKT